MRMLSIEMHPWYAEVINDNCFMRRVFLEFVELYPWIAWKWLAAGQLYTSAS